MDNLWAKAIGIGGGFVVANYLYQWVGSANWQAAFERSFFQCLAIAAFALVLKVTR